MSNNEYKAEYAKTGRATCKWKECKQLINAGELRLAKMYPSPFSDGLACDWFHPECIFKALKRAKSDSKLPRRVDVIQGFDDLEQDDQDKVRKLVEEFDEQRTEQDAGKGKKKATPKKPTAAKAAASPAKPTLDFTHAQTAPKPKPQPKARPAPPPVPEIPDPHRFKEILSEPWLSGLLPVLNLLPDIESKLGVTASGVVPPRDDVFECLQGLKPADIKVVVIGGRPAKSSNAASGYAFLDATARTVRSDRLPCAGNWGDQLSDPLANIFKAVASADGNLPKDVDSFKSTTVRRFYERTKKEGVLWLNAELTTNISGSTPTTISPFWYPIILKIFKMIFQSRLEHKDDRGVVVALFGDGFSELQTAILSYFSRVSSKFPIRISKTNDPSVTKLPIDEDSNPFTLINLFLMECGHEPVAWIPSNANPQPSEPVAKSHVKVEKQVLEQASVEPSPSSKGTAFVLHSLDGGPSITIPNSKAPYFIQYKDIGQTKPNPTAKIGQVSFLDEETVNYYPLVENQFIWAHQTNKFTMASVGVKYSLKVGDCLSYMGDEHSYKLMLPNDNPPKSVPRPIGDDEELARKLQREFDSEEPRLKRHGSSLLQNKKRKAAEESENGDEDFGWSAKLSSSKPKKPKHVDDEDYEPVGAVSVPIGGIAARVKEDSAMDVEDDDQELPVCQYGPACYRKNPLHFKQFAHPWLDK